MRAPSCSTKTRSIGAKGPSLPVHLERRAAPCLLERYGWHCKTRRLLAGPSSVREGRQAWTDVARAFLEMQKLEYAPVPNPTRELRTKQSYVAWALTERPLSSWYLRLETLRCPYFSLIDYTSRLRGLFSHRTLGLISLLPLSTTSSQQCLPAPCDPKTKAHPLTTSTRPRRLSLRNGVPSLLPVYLAGSANQRSVTNAATHLDA